MKDMQDAEKAHTGNATVADDNLTVWLDVHTPVDEVMMTVGCSSDVIVMIYDVNKNELRFVKNKPERIFDCDGKEMK